MDLDPRRLLDELQPAKTIIVMAARYCKYLCQIGYENSRKKKTHQNRDISPWKAGTQLKQCVIKLWDLEKHEIYKC